ncbi:class I SAM-dependent methyltransferase [Palleronia sediminis]|uniref:Class I SAM-dependent methyltransferase n=1 Tax=Palleronia sediminis TaxID=2547833 RepID=A0A4R6A075_9RHOB|nr:cyclopropane-fatty-acyl-phospholipid synthase family protein [Palleronia sediminis]TDL76045.1 class I SAM-dependent methyltransferase [Palleronia sediminis]
MWEAAFERVVRAIIVRDRLHITLPSGRRFTTGDGPRELAVRIRDRRWLRAILASPDLGLAEGYMEGDIEIENDDLRLLLSIALGNTTAGNRHALNRVQLAVRRRLRAVEQWNPASRARQNVAHHYDLSRELYDIFLDEDRQYSCAYFRSPQDTLEQAQLQKKRHIARKLLIEPGMRVLDIGCGWGGMGLTLASEFGARVTGVTLSTEQHAMATQRAEDAGLSDRVEFLLADYRDLDRQFDRIVSVGMFEHVGVPHYDEYFGKVRDMLTEDGIALIHTIGRSDPPGSTSPFIAKYIFPGGYIPALSETAAAIERQRLVTADIEVWRLHYAETLRHWEERFSAGIERARALYDDRFCRMWRFYLIASEMSFRAGTQIVFQFQLSRRNDAVPITRDYLYS